MKIFSIRNVWNEIEEFVVFEREIFRFFKKENEKMNLNKYI
jgi:hypothetical protein